MASGVEIRSYRPDDAKSLFEAALESSAEVYPWATWCHPGYSVEDAKEWSLAKALEFEKGHEFEFVITGEGGRFLGGCALNQINLADRTANLGYWVRSSATGNGVATEAVRQAVRFAFSNTNLERLEIVCAVNNRASQRVAEKAGAVREGVARSRIYLQGGSSDAVVFSILRSDGPAV